MTSFGLVLFIPVLLFLLGRKILPDILKKVEYLFKHRDKGKELDINKNETPILILEYNGQDLFALKCAVITAFVTVLAIFFAASIIARDDKHPFIFLNKEQSYILYYWAWKFATLFLLIWFGNSSITLFNKYFLFFKDGIIVQNSLTGTKSFAINNNVYLVKSPNQDAYWLYDNLKEAKLQIFNRSFMILDSQQEKLLAEFIANIPEKKKTFYY